MAIVILRESGNGQSAGLNKPYQKLKVQVMDTGTLPNTPVTNGSVQFQNTNNLVTQPAAPFGGAGASNAECGSGGYATSATPTANNVAGKVTIRCWGFGTEVLFTLNNKPPSGPPEPSTIAVGTGNNQTLLQGGGPGVLPTVLVTDQFDAPYPGATVQFVLPSSGPGGTFNAGGTTANATTDVNGIATCPAFTANSQIGPWQLLANVTGTLVITTFADVQAQFSLYTNPASGVEVCTAATIPSSSVQVARPGSTTVWVNPQNWPATGGAVAQNFYGTTAAGEFSNNIYASGIAAAVAAIPNDAEITRVTFSHQAQNGTTGGCQLKVWLENTAFGTPKISSDATFNIPKNNTFAVNTFNWTTFNTPNPGSKLLGADVKNAGFRIGVFNTFTNGILEAGTVSLKLLTLTICYIQPAAITDAGALNFCEV